MAAKGRESGNNEICATHTSRLCSKCSSSSSGDYCPGWLSVMGMAKGVCSSQPNPLASARTRGGIVAVGLRELHGVSVFPLNIVRRRCRRIVQFDEAPRSS